jgi:arylsulfatase A
MRFLLLTVSLTFCALLPKSLFAETPLPNIILILADDFGVGDIQAHYPNNKIATPHLDQLVRQGRSFTDAHSPSAVCSPTRYGILTGRYAWRTRLQEWVVAAYEPPLISPDRPTLPGMLRQAGYHTACIGKWHLGWNWPGPQTSQMMEKRNGLARLNWDYQQPIQGGPLDRGFDEFFGVDLPNLPPFTYIEGRRTQPEPTAEFDPQPEEGIVLPNGFRGTPAAPNWRMQDILPTITHRATEVIAREAQTTEPFFLYFSLTSPHEPVVPSDGFRGKSGIAPIADFVMETDWAVGKILQAIEDAGISDNTLVIFTADNGHSHYTGWEDLIAAGHLPSGPFRGHKGDIWEGGHRVPLVIRWPGQVSPNSASNQLICLTDFYATLAAVCLQDLPTRGAEDSLSFYPSLLGQNREGQRTQVVNHSNFGEFAYRDGPWKLVYRMGEKNLQASRGQPTVAELYDLEQDPFEKVNVASRFPEQVARLTKQLQQLIDRGATRREATGSNDGVVEFKRTQSLRWAPSPSTTSSDSKQ